MKKTKMVPVRSKQEAVAMFRKGAILDAACRAFGRSGFAETTMDSIAAEAGIAKGTVYLYYKSKADVYAAALSSRLERLHEETAQRMAEASKCREKIELFIRIRLQYFDEHRDFYRIYTTEFGSAVSKPAPLARQLKKMYLRQADLLKEALEGGIRAGEIRPVPAAAIAFTIYDLTRGLLHSRMAGWFDESPETSIDTIMDLFWNGLVPAKKKGS